MENIKTKVEGNKLIIEVDLSYRGSVSTTGKSIRVASTEGNKKIEGTNLKMGINIYEPTGA